MADNKQTPKASSTAGKSGTKTAKTTEKKADKNNVFARIKQFFKDVKGESKKIVWNSRADTFKNTGVVLLVTLFVGAGVWISDVVFRELIDLVYRLAADGGESAMIMLQGLIDLL